MIDEARILRPGPLLALLKWASMMKQFILYTIFCNVLPATVGVSRLRDRGGRARRRGGAVPANSLLVALTWCGRNRAIAVTVLPISGTSRGVVSFWQFSAIVANQLR